jgi:hypothetical protein
MEIEIKLDEAHAALLSAFRDSPEFAVLPGDGFWVAAFLDWMQTCDVGWGEIDLASVQSALFDGLGWYIEAAPPEPGVVAEELSSFLRWADRCHGVPGAADSVRYLSTAIALCDIRRWLQPVEFVCGECR